MRWDVVEDAVLVLFSSGLLTDKEFYAQFKCGEHGGMVRNLLRKNGVQKVRSLAKRAIARRKKVQTCVVLPNTN